LNNEVYQRIEPEETPGKENPYDDYDLRVTFNNHAGELLMIKSLFPIADCLKFRYFEVEVMENRQNSQIYFGIIEASEQFNNHPGSINNMI
jgi:hypothetical protein